MDIVIDTSALISVIVGEPERKCQRRRDSLKNRRFKNPKRKMKKTTCAGTVFQIPAQGF